MNRLSVVCVAGSLLVATLAVSAAPAAREPRIAFARVLSTGPETFTYRDTGDLFTMRPDGTATSRLTKTRAWETDPAWSPDGGRIAFTRGSPICHADRCWGTDVASVWIARADGGGARRLTRGADDVADRSASWSPDARRLVFARANVADDSPDDGVYVVESNGVGLRRLLAERARAVDWSSDGERIAVLAETGAGARLEVVDAESGATEHFAATGLPQALFDVDWSPDGKRLAVLAAQGIYVLPGRGGRAVGVLATRPPASGVSWSPDGRSLAFGARNDLFVVGANGRGLRRLTRTAPEEFAPSWRP